MQAKDFEKFASITMQEANQLHAICLDTMPAIFYMNQTSKNIVNMARDINAEQADKKNIVAYSIDAGFHVFLFCMKQQEDLVLERIRSTKVISDNLEKVIQTSIDPNGIECVDI